MSQPQPPDPDPDDLEQLGRPIYQGDGLQVRGLTEEELARFLAAHAGQPAQLLGSGWNHLEPATTAPSSLSNAAGPPAVGGPPRGSYGDPGASAGAVYRRLRAAELADWSSSLAWRLPLAGGAGIATTMLTSQLPGMVRMTASLVVAGVVGWRLRFAPRPRPAPGARAPAGSGAPPAGCAASSVAATSSSTTWPCPARAPTSTICCSGRPGCS